MCKNHAKALMLVACLCLSSDASADTVQYTLDNMMMSGTQQLIGTFTWTYTPGDFENGAGQFTNLDVPWTYHNETDLNATFDVGNSIEITLPGSVHDDGVDISLFLLQPLTPTSSATLDLSRSKYDIGGNGFHAGSFLSGSVTPEVTVGVPTQDSIARQLQASPNPFSSGTVIQFDLARTGIIDLRVFDVKGRIVRVLAQQEWEAGPHHVHWNGTDENGILSVPGVYFFQLMQGVSAMKGKLVRLN